MFYVGTSGYSYAEWKGSFYPEKLSPKKFLSFYANEFRSVEINNTFYRLPSTALTGGWASEVPENFRFVLKASQSITHFGRLRDVESACKRFFEAHAALKDRRGPILFQLPPNFKADKGLLEEFLGTIPKDILTVWEFGNKGWQTDEIYSLLSDHNASLCIVDDEKKGTPFVETCNFGYARLRRVEYTDQSIDAWAKKFESAKWKDAFIFFKHEDAGTGPKLAKRLLASLGEEQPAFSLSLS